MKVKELIAKLQKFDQEKEAAVSAHTGEIEYCYGCYELDNEKGSVCDWPNGTIIIDGNR